MRRYSWNILQWNKNDIKSKKMTNGDYYHHAFFTTVADSTVWLHFDANWCKVIRFVLVNPSNMFIIQIPPVTYWPLLNLKAT